MAIGAGAFQSRSDPGRLNSWIVCYMKGIGDESFNPVLIPVG